MKKFVIATVIALMPLTGFSQSIFDKFEDMDGVASVIINKGMFDLLAKVDADMDEEAREFKELVDALKGVKVFMTESKEISASMKSTVDSYLKSSSMEELMRVKDDDTHVKFYIKNGKDDNHVEELLMFVTGIDEMKMGRNGKDIETVLVSLTGDIDLRKIGKLTKKMNLPHHMHKADKKGE